MWRKSMYGLAIIALLLSLVQWPANAAGELTVAQSIAQQNGTQQTVQGYIVGQPTATTQVVTSNYPSDYAIALADVATETNVSKMVYV